jgi:brefeldin A-inhibited guanine nucleotide-exchange protein
MKHLPNLLKQESSSAATLVHVLLRMYYDNRPEHEAARPQIAKQLMPSVFSHFLGFSHSYRGK